MHRARAGRAEVKRLLFLALVGCSSAPKQDTALPSQCVVCDPDAGQTVEAGILVDDGMLAARKDEYGPMFDTHITWTGPSAEPHIRIGGGFESGAGLTRDHRVRILVDTVGAFGALGDTSHGMVFFGADLRLKVSLLPDMTLFDIYGIASTGALGGVVNVPHGFAPIGIAGGGLGFRLFRSLSVEATFNAAHAFDAPFASASGSRQDSVFDFNIGARFDLCSLGTWCDLDPIKQTRTDLTCALYEQAAKACEIADAASKRDALCTKALAAMSTSDRDEPTLARDAVTSFIGKLGDGDLAKKDSCLVGWRTCGRSYECSLAQRGQKPTDHRIYSPYVIELMTALGCDASGKPTAACGYVCEDAIQDKDKGVCAAH